jgi:hypothetical protein
VHTLGRAAAACQWRQLSARMDMQAYNSSGFSQNQHSQPLPALGLQHTEDILSCTQNRKSNQSHTQKAPLPIKRSDLPQCGTQPLVNQGMTLQLWFKTGKQCGTCGQHHCARANLYMYLAQTNCTQTFPQPHMSHVTCATCQVSDQCVQCSACSSAPDNMHTASATQAQRQQLGSRQAPFLLLAANGHE